MRKTRKTIYTTMKNTLNIILLLIVITSSCSSEKKLSKIIALNNRLEILGRSFSNSEVKSIDIVQIEHSMLGGIIASTTLTDQQKETFLTDFDHLKEKGICKCMSKYVIRLNFEKDTLRLKVCDKIVSNRTNDLYYELENGKSIIEEYIDIK